MKLEYLRDLFLKWCEAERFEILERRVIPHGEQVVVVGPDGKSPVNFYATGRMLVQGPPSELRDRINEWAKVHAVEPDPKSAKKPAASVPHFPDRVGIDESGKGDYFGPLVICAAFARAEDDAWLSELGVKDSKKLADKPLLKLATEIADAVPHETVVVAPAKYNELYEQVPNLNRILAWGHARSLETLLGKVQAGAAISDQFGDRRYLERALMEKGRAIKLVQMHRAEEDMAVAAASVLARAVFLRYLSRMSREYEMEFSKGASTQVEQEAREFVKRHGEEQLRSVAKLHFKTTLRVLSAKGPGTKA